MRIISGQISSLIRNSSLLSETAKSRAIARDVEHAKFYESAGSRAIYCIGADTTHLQFVGVHTGQRHAITDYLKKADQSTEVYFVSRHGSERLNMSGNVTDIEHMDYKITGFAVHERAGKCIAQNMQIREACHGAEVTFEPGHDYRATPTELAALRMIALHECMKSFGPFVQVSSLLVGKADVTRPQHYKGPLVMIAGLEGTMSALVSEDFQALAAPAGKRHILPWYEMARKRQSLV